jgi:predicted TIM-barrel fold metal-dependent hydrolase
VKDLGENLARFRELPLGEERLRRILEENPRKVFPD